MKILLLLLFVNYFFFVQLENFDHKLLCESCIAVAKEIEKTLQDASTKSSRQAVIKKLLHGAVCDKLSEDKRSSCRHLLGIHGEDFKEALSKKVPKQLHIALCYEQSPTCVGVKLQRFKDHTTTLFDSDVDVLLSENKDKVQFAKPIHSRSTVQTKEEL